MVAGYEDANDCNTLRDDSILKMNVGRFPMTGHPLVSQSTMTRFEISIDAFITGKYDEKKGIGSRYDQNIA
ncbi:MAG: hypothetical protein Q8R96_18990 [Bacteroidota bacterium]|nr:hypothetical protein [Bacteroidota bacterium]